ncbi:unnamed protein product [Thelazia callipaeda]|uniref:Phorbol-ester/DAG-type domain-containing protein n=1 Tax=Thelazia callipaeda TaxID=103827 RepID=A0A0N5D7J6_THECL|nr:unnamed protein product [Thelazia callipaeda]
MQFWCLTHVILYREFYKSSSYPKKGLSGRLTDFPSAPSNYLPKLVDTPLKDEIISSVNCICDRPASHIVCTRCGFELVGRLQKVCPNHPKKLALMDHRECPNRLCKSIHLIEVSLQHQ